MKTFLKYIYRNIREPIKKTALFKKFEHFVVNNYFKCTYGITKDEFESNLQYCSYPREVNIDGIDFTFADIITSNTVEYVRREFEAADIYDFKNMKFSEGDVVIDIGANVGIVSIYLAKKYPFLKIYSYEPVTQNYQNFLKNIKLNKIPKGVIFPYNMAVTSDGRDVDMSVIDDNYGGSAVVNIVSKQPEIQEYNTNIPSTTFEDIVKEHSIKEIKLLKIDCEGSEYEILYSTPEEILKNIKIMRGEFHEVPTSNEEYNIKKLSEYVKSCIEDVKYEVYRGD